ncbi:MAG: GGDEF domain-containing phosphodiesterase [Lachnospiraceae bacterium]|nr:GGDEF domain-containing phosphodiesterase [Lachnospiraceae bacterium]
MNKFYGGANDHRQFIEEAGKLLKEDTDLVFVSLDISNFKYINDFYGTEAGDSVLIKLEDYYFKSFPKCLVVHCLGSDQYRGIYDITGYNREQVVKDLQDANIAFEQMLSEAYPMIYHHVYMGVCFREANSPIRDPRFYIDGSHMAKKICKNKLNINVNVYDDKKAKVILEDNHMQNEFMRACDDNRILLYLQPKVNVHTKEVVGAEALVRMKDSTGAIIPPGKFLPLLEKTGMVGKLDDLMIRKVFEYQRKRLDLGENCYPVSVNVSRIKFMDEGFYEYVISLQEEFQISSDLVAFEILESTFNNPLSEMTDTINMLRKAGFLVEVDDFGSGYSSLNQIAGLPADVIKMDRLFAISSLSTKKGRKIVESVIQMLKKVDYSIIFEGIETEEQLQLVTEYGCEVIQGYIFSKPIAEEDFVRLYGKNRMIQKEA